MGLYEFDEGSGERFWMDKGNAGAATAGTRLLIDQPGALGLEVGQRRVNVGDGQGNVMHSLTAGFDESPDRCFWSKWLEKLDERTANGDHCFFDSLLGNNLAVHRLRTEEAGVLSERLIQVTDGQCDVVEVVGEHDRKIVQYH